MESIIETNQI